MSPMFYGPDQAAIHHARFGDLAREAARLVLVELARAGIRSGTIADFGCGSGIFARIAGDAGFDVVGTDVSEAMVALARATAPGATFRVGSVHDAEVPPAVAVTALGEVLNYATDPRAGLDALGRFARRAHDALAPGGVLVCDTAGPGRAGAGTQRFHADDGWALGMTASERDGVLERRITIFTRAGDAGYRRVEETHVLRLYDPAEVVAVLRGTGFGVEVRDGYATPAPFPGWHVFVARRS